MLMQDVEIVPFSTPASMWVSIRKLIEKKPDERMFLWVYWGKVDGISHLNGPDDERAAAEFAHYSTAFENLFVEKLCDKMREDTLVILTADHGQTATRLNPKNVLANHPDLRSRLRIMPTCENRLAFLYPRPGHEGAVRDYFQAHWPDQFELITRDNALKAGLFGNGSHHPDLHDRIGDLIAIAQQDAYLWWANQADFLLGRHGSLHHQDMLVPFLAARL
jgi:predicted AlkP superfamily pyrophosphatase or phosphodiesterase